ncbi:MAG: rhomboid family intramembrane serine protease [Beijerinckiaceae bacterium]
MVFIPLSDEAPERRHEPPYVTYAIIALNVLVFLWRASVSSGEDVAFSLRWGVVPDDLFGGRILPLLTYMFLHGGFAHLIGNMLFLWIFGDDIEDAFGHALFAAFYLFCGIVGALVYCAIAQMRSAPLVGASGAIAGVMGAYLMIRPCAHVNVLVFIRVIPIRAMWVIAAWTVFQIWHVLAPGDGNVAWWAHIGGLLAGAALTVFVRRPGVGLFECVDQQKYVSPWSGPPVNRTRR